MIFLFYFFVIYFNDTPHTSAVKLFSFQVISEPGKSIFLLPRYCLNRNTAAQFFIRFNFLPISPEQPPSLYEGKKKAPQHLLPPCTPTQPRAHALPEPYGGALPHTDSSAARSTSCLNSSPTPTPTLWRAHPTQVTRPCRRLLIFLAPICVLLGCIWRRVTDGTDFFLFFLNLTVSLSSSSLSSTTARSPISSTRTAQPKSLLPRTLRAITAPSSALEVLKPRVRIPNGSSRGSADFTSACHFPR